MPTLASANGVDGLLNGITGGGSGGTSGGGTAASPTPESGVPPNYVPPLHGANPHGQGTDAVVDIAPSDANPLDPNDSGEDIFVGDSRGEQNADGTYHGSVTALHALGLENLLNQLVPGLLMIQSNPGEDNAGALDPLNQGLNQLCTATMQLLCLNVLDMHSATTATGSTNSFSAANVGIGGTAIPISAQLVTSDGNISHDPATGCQTAHGDSQVVGASVISPAILGAQTIKGTSETSP